MRTSRRDNIRKDRSEREREDTTMYRCEREVGYKNHPADEYATKQYDRTGTRQELENHKTWLVFSKESKEKKLKTLPVNSVEHKALTLALNTCTKKLKTVEQKLNNGAYGKRKAVVTHPKKQSLTVLECKILKLIAEMKKDAKAAFLTKEDTAKYLHARVSQVEQVFMTLNRKGILTQPVHRAPHDSSRDPQGYESNHEWMSDRYYFV